MGRRSGGACVVPQPARVHWQLGTLTSVPELAMSPQAQTDRLPLGHSGSMLPRHLYLNVAAVYDGPEIVQVDSTKLVTHSPGLVAYCFSQLRQYGTQVPAHPPLSHPVSGGTEVTRAGSQTNHGVSEPPP